MDDDKSPDKLQGPPATSHSQVLDTYDPDWEDRHARHLAENRRVLEEMPLVPSSDHLTDARETMRAFQTAFLAQFRTVADYLEWTKGWSIHRTHTGRMIPWPELYNEATRETVDETVTDLEVLTKRVSAAEYGLERIDHCFGVFDAEPAHGFKRSVYTVEDCWNLWKAGEPYTMGVIEDRSEDERHIAIIPPMLKARPYLQPWTLEGFLERTGMVKTVRPRWFDRWRPQGMRTFVYLFRVPEPEYRYVRLERYEPGGRNTGNLEATEHVFKAMPQALLDVWIATDPAVGEALQLPVWSKEAWDAFYLSSAERRRPN